MCLLPNNIRLAFTFFSVFCLGLVRGGVESNSPLFARKRSLIYVPDEAAQNGLMQAPPGSPTHSSLGQIFRAEPLQIAGIPKMDSIIPPRGDQAAAVGIPDIEPEGLVPQSVHSVIESLQNGGQNVQNPTSPGSRIPLPGGLDESISGAGVAVSEGVGAWVDALSQLLEMQEMLEEISKNVGGVLERFRNAGETEVTTSEPGFIGRRGKGDDSPVGSV